MMPQHVKQALTQVRELRARVIASNLFAGYSGIARMIGGCIALTASLVLTFLGRPAVAWIHVLAWGAVFTLSVGVNYGALLWWGVRGTDFNTARERLSPAVDLLPSLLVGGLLTAAFLLRGAHDLLFGMWMCVFGITNLVSRHILPDGIGLVGVYYIVAGAVCLLHPDASFTNPWPMGLVFLVGEVAGGWVLHRGRTRKESV